MSNIGLYFGRICCSDCEKFIEEEYKKLLKELKDL